MASGLNAGKEMILVSYFMVSPIHLETAWFC